MQTRLSGTYVIPWTQTELDGQSSPSVAEIGPGRTWVWTGDAVRVDGPTEVVPLGAAEGDAELRRRAALTVRRLLRSIDANVATPAPPLLQDPLFDKSFVVTDGYGTWDISLIPQGAGRKPLLLFIDDVPPRDTDLWIVRHTIDAQTMREETQTPQGVICFTPGTMILTPYGPRAVESLREGDRVQTKDNGSSEILWLGKREITGARLMAMPALAPVRLRAGALDKDVPDAGLLVSPDHRIILRGARARALFNAEEVLVTARDLIDDHAIMRDYSVKKVTYIHMFLQQHEVVFANSVATETFHPASAALASMHAPEKNRLFERMPEVADDPHNYGAFARRVLTDSEAAILRADL